MTATPDQPVATTGVSPLIVDLCRSLHHGGALLAEDDHTASAQGGAVADGALLVVQVRLHNDVVDSCRFQAYGCAATIAVGEWLCRWATGKTRQDIHALDHRQLVDALELTNSKVHCAVLAVRTINAALNHLRS